MVVYACDPNTWKEEVGGSKVQAQTGCGGVAFNPSFQKQRQVEIDELEASLIYIVPGQLGLSGETVSKIQTKASDPTTEKQATCAHF